MNALIFAFVASVFALPVAGMIIIAVCVYGDIQSKKQMKHFEAAMHKCKTVQGWTFTSRLLDRCSKDRLPVANRIELLEHFAGIKDMHVAIAERSRKT